MEQAGDWKRLLEHMALLSEAHGDHEEAAKLRAQLLHPQTIPQGIVEPEPVYTAEPQPKRERRKKPALSSLTALQASRLAWEEVRRRRGQ